MPDRATVTQAIQIGLEATPGTVVPANKTLRSVSLDIGIEGESDIHRPEGHKWPNLAVPGPEWTGADLRGKPTYTELCYLAEAHFQTAAVVADGTNGKKRIYTIANTVADTKKTLTVEQGDGVRAHRFAYGMVPELGFEFTRQATNLTGAMIGQLLSDGIAMTAAPADIALKPIVPKTVDVFLDDTFGALGTTKLLRAFKVAPKIGNRFAPVWALNSAVASFDGDVELPPAGEVALTVEADAAGMAAGLTPFRSGATKFMRIKALGDVIAGAVASAYTFQLDLALKIRQPQKFEDADGVFAIGFNAAIVRDDAWAKAVELTLINEIAVL